MPVSEQIAIAPHLVFDAITAGAPGAPLVLLVLLCVALVRALDRILTHFMASLAVGVSVLVERTLELGH